MRDAGLQRRAGQSSASGSWPRAASAWPDWQFVVLDSPQLNAFALPGGKVGVFTGMLQIMANEAQLATVLGHEVGHVNARHGAQRIVAENAVSLALRLGPL